MAAPIGGWGAFILALASCHSAKKMEESTDVVSVADVRFEDSLATTVSLIFDELDIWCSDVVTDTLSVPAVRQLKHIKIRNGQFRKEQEETTKVAHKDSIEFVSHNLLHKETNAPP